VQRRHPVNRLEGMSLRRLFTDHPASVGETYAQHMRVATSFALRLMAGGLACLVHAVFPFLFEQTASRFVGELHQQMIVQRTRIGRIKRTPDPNSAR